MSAKGVMRKKNTCAILLSTLLYAGIPGARVNTNNTSKLNSLKCWIETSKVLGNHGFLCGPPSQNNCYWFGHKLLKLLHFHHMIKILSVQIFCARIILSTPNSNISRWLLRNRGQASWFHMIHALQVVLTWLLLSCWSGLWLCHQLKLRTHFLIQTMLWCLEETVWLRTLNLHPCVDFVDCSEPYAIWQVQFLHVALPRCYQSF